MNKLPQVRNENIVVQNIDGEVLIYFFDTNKAICLNSTSAIVFNHCNGKTTFDELKNKYNFTEDLIYFTLEKLNENNLLKEYHSKEHFIGLSRREVIKRVGMGSMLALPIISSIIAPTSVQAASNVALGQPCTNPGSSSQCASPNTCVNQTGGGARCCTSTSGTYSPGVTLPVGNVTSSSCASFAQFCCNNSTSSDAVGGGNGACRCAA